MRFRTARALTGLSAAAALAGALVAPSAASACGGFFCNQSAPVEQTGEHILFAVDEEQGTTEAHVLINYAGPSEEFAWIVPTPGFPEIGLSSFGVFSRLQSMTAPRWVLEWSQIGTCSWDDWMFEGDGAPTAGAGDPRDEDGGVTVVARESVGPYDTVILQATAADVLVEWLQDNGYDVPDDILPYVEPYVLMGGDIHFVAFKLQSDRDAGDIQPVTLTYDGIKPTIPIQLTAVATVPDLGVTAYVLGRHRAVPENYLSVEVNQARIDWLRGGANYAALVVEAMNEAGGHGFRTEFAGASSLFAGFFVPTSGYDYDAIATSDVFSLVGRLQAQGFFGDASLLELFRRHIPVPDGVDEQSFYNCIECYAELVDADAFDPVAFADEMWTTMIEPLEHAQELFDRLPYLTRLYTALSAEEMTLDPIFAFNPDLGDQSNVHRAQAIVDCGDGGDYYGSPIVIRLEDGRELVTGWEVERGDLDSMPAAESFAETGATGQPRVIQDNTPSIEVALAEHNQTVSESFFLPNLAPRDRGCAATGGAGPGTGLALMALLALLPRSRRRA